MPIADKIYGPLTITINDITSGLEAFGVNKEDFVTIDIESIANKTEFEDDGAADHTGGRRVKIEFDASDVIPADMDTVESYQGDIEVLLQETGKLITFPGTALQPNDVITSMADKKNHVLIQANWPIGTTMADMFQITTP